MILRVPAAFLFVFVALSGVASAPAAAKEDAPKKELSKEEKEAAAALAAAPGDAAAAGGGESLDEWKVKREENFAFAQAPAVERAGDRVTIRFETQGFCDVSIALEDPDGKIVRHLASGVLGPKAPAPLQAGTKKQAVVWDGKDDEGKYVDAKDALSVRVSLGLKPRFERSLLWEPRRRLAHGTSYGADSYPAPLVACTPEGVFVDDGGGTALDHVRLFDHEGNYVRTVYPFPAEKVKDVVGLPWHTYPQDGRALPVKGSFMQNTMLTSGDSWAPTYNAQKGVFHTNGRKEIAHFGMHGSGATTMAAAAGRIALAHQRLVRLAAGGGTGGLALSGPKVSFTAALPMTYAGPGGNFEVSPRSSALSPDGKWLYLAGYIYHKNLVFNGKHGVARVAMDGEGETEVWQGEMDKPGADAAHFHYPLSVACDAKGNVYVADYMNDRVQVFGADGKLQRSVPAAKPAHVAVHHASGDLYVFSWHITNQALKGQAAEREKKQEKLQIPAVLSIYAAGEAKAKAACPIPFESYNGTVTSYYGSFDGLQYRVALDSWTEPPTIWMVASNPDRMGRVDWSKAALRLLTLKDGKLAVKRDFGQEAEQYAPVTDGRQRLYFNPATGKLYADPAGRHFSSLLEIDPATGKTGRLELPVTCEDMAFDRDGYAYLKTFTELVRYNPASWREIPFDYGEEREIEQAYKKKPFLGCLVLPAVATFHHGGLWVSPKGRIAVGCLYEAPKAKRIDEKESYVAGKPYAPRLFPGRTTSYNYGATYVHVWDKHGQVLYDDAVPGLGGTLGVGIDADDSLYVLSASTRAIAGKPYFNDAAGTLMKFRPKQGRILCMRSTPVPLEGGAKPDRPADVGVIPGPGWVEGAEWMYGGVGIDGKKWVGCSCWSARFALDGYARVFAPEIDRYAVAVLDTNGNLILRVGYYGNADDGQPLVADGGPPAPRALGGDEVSLMNGAYVAADSDRRLFIADPGNGRISGVKLGYHTEAKVALKDVKDAAE
ncbi:MAG: hypothetical protein L6R28_13530 [Planctomycetes bacterium]|nr:hypothetical protein [Planctomycetota bacterium]